MKLSLKDQARSTALGLLSLALPMALINYATHDAAPAVVLACVLIASIVGYGFGGWTVSRAYEEEANDTCSEGSNE